MAIKQDKGLKRTIGLFGLSANIINIIVGAGIFALPAIVAQNMGASSIIAYAFCGILMALIMLCYAEVGSKITNTGGSYAFIETAFGDYAGFLSGIFNITSCLLADAAVSNALIDVLGSALPIFGINSVRILTLFTIFFGLAYVNVIGIKQGIGLVIFNTCAKLFPLILLVLVAWKDVSLSNLSWTEAPTIKQLGETSLILFFAFQGGEVGLTVGGEVINPKRTVPKAIFISISTVVVLYILIQLVSQGVLGESLPNYTASPLAETAKVVMGKFGYLLLLAGAMISMFGNLSGEVLNNPRVIYALSRDRVLPSKQLAKIHKTFATPYIAVILYASIAFILAATGTFEQLAPIATGSLLIVYLGVVLSVIKLRRSKKIDQDGFKIPGGLTVPLLSCVIILYFLSYLSVSEKIGTFIFIVLLSILYAFIKVFNKT
ncbi:APC family permease [Mangrovimonas sp. TPBH4]|uniref:APC family permease n=1 Tax=Mangrovimonas sp. TPBH4 TaxID=1645914 RepID=UPI0006B5DDE9|nr:APC family permease [Mangrovimonas sp. TPBH4]